MESEQQPVADPPPRDEKTVQEMVRTKVKAERSPRDMALSLLVLLVPIALFCGFYRLVLGGDDPVRIDPAPAISQARSAGAFPVGEPAGLGADWTVSSAAFRTVDAGKELRIGYVTPDGGGLQLLQSNVPAETLIPTELGAEARPEGTADVGGLTWQRYAARPGERALVLLEPARTVIVVGRADEGELRELAASLR